jgi:hypothetical protein
MHGTYYTSSKYKLIIEYLLVMPLLGRICVFLREKIEDILYIPLPCCKSIWLNIIINILDGHTDRQTDTHTHRHIDIYIDRHTDRYTDRHTHTHTDT